MQMNKTDLVGKSLEADKAWKVPCVWPSVCCCLRFHRTRFWRSGRVQNTRLNWAGWPRLGTGSCSLPPGTSTTSATARTGVTPTQCSLRISPVCGAACYAGLRCSPVLALIGPVPNGTLHVHLRSYGFTMGAACVLSPRDHRVSQTSF